MRKLIHNITAVYLIFIFISSFSNAQISGVVKDAKSFAPVSNVNILVEGSNKGTSTKPQGEFALDIVSFPVTLHLSALGFESRTVKLYRPETALVVFLKPTSLGLEEIVVLPDRTINPITNSSPIARSSVSIEQLSAKSATTAVELLRAESGVFVQQTSVGQGSLYIRGRSGRDVLYLFNGMRMNPSFVRSGQNQYFGAIDPLLLNKIDVYRGPISVYYGGDALSGGVNISPIIHDYSKEPGFKGEVLSTLNVNGNGEKTIHGKLAYQAPGFSLFAGGSFRDFDYYKMSAQTNESLWFPYSRSLSNADYQFKSFQLSSKIKTARKSDLTLISYFGEIPDATRLDRVTLGFSIESESEGISPQYGNYSNTSPLSFWGNTAEYRIAKVNSIFESVGIKAGFFRLKDFQKQQDFENEPKFSVIQENRVYNFDLSDTILFDQNTSNQLQFSVDVRSYINDDLYLKWGGDIAYDNVESRRYTNMGETILPRYPNGSKYILSGIFAQVDQLLSDGLSLEYGVRYSHTYVDIPFEGFETDRRFDPYSISFGQLTGALGITYEMTKGFTFLSNISSGFRAPNVSDLSEVGIRRSFQFQTPSIERLSPEKTANFDIGFQIQNEFINAEFFAFWLHYFDKISRVETGIIVDEYGQPTGARELDVISNFSFYEVTNRNANAMDLLGIEFRGGYKINKSVKSGLTFTYTWGDLTNEKGIKEPADRIPPANGVFYINYEPVDRISFRPQARYAFTHRRISSDEVNDVRVSKDGTDGFINIQLLVNYVLKKDLTLKIVADNLADTSYREHASSLDGMGRNFTFTLSYSF